MARGAERLARVREALREGGCDALLCTLPANVLLLSGYWPVVGSAVAVASREGRVLVLAPEDERELAERGWATEVLTFQPGSLTHLSGPAEAIVAPLAAALGILGIASGRIAVEDGDAYEPVSYAAMYLYGTAAMAVTRAAAPDATITSAAPLLARLRPAMTDEEVAQVRRACAIAGPAFDEVARAIRPGLREPEVAALLDAAISARTLSENGVERAGAFAYCMSGPNAALAGAAYARTRNRALCAGDLVLVHCNSYLDGYWTDITRTYCLGEPDKRQRAMYEAVLEARAAALAAIRPGAQAAEVDRAAREVLTARGFGAQFTHGLGHNVGFSAISAEYLPRLYPASTDTLEVGMTFNVEPAIYIAGYGGMRHCDVVTVSAAGGEVLTPFQAAIDDLTISR